MGVKGRSDDKLNMLSHRTSPSVLENSDFYIEQSKYRRTVTFVQLFERIISKIQILLRVRHQWRLLGKRMTGLGWGSSQTQRYDLLAKKGIS